MKKLSIFLFTAILILAGCGSSQEGDDVLTIWAWDANYNIPILEKAAEIYNQTNPEVEFNIVEKGLEDIEQSLHTSFASGTTQGLPDIVLIQDDKAQLFLNSYPDAFYAMDDAINTSDFLDYKVSTCQYQEATYCLPFDSGVAGLFYRKDIYEEAGYTAADLEDITWSKYFEIADDVYQQTGAKSLNYYPSKALIKIMMQSAGSWFADDEYTNLKDNPVLVEALETSNEIHNAEWALETTDRDQYVSGLNSGELASISEGVWIISTLTQSSDQSGKWAVAPTPKLEVDGATMYSNSGGGSLYVVNGTGDEELAADFLGTAFTTEDIYDFMLSEVGAIGSYIPALDSDVYQEEIAFFDNEPIYATMAEWAEAVPSVEYTPEAAEVISTLDTMSNDYFTGKVTVEELLDNVQAQALDL